MTDGSRAARITLELVVVIGGVLIALAADSWRENWQEQRRLEDNLRALLQDMSLATVEIDRAIQRDSVRIVEIDAAEAVLLHGTATDAGQIDLNSLGITIPPLPLGTLRFLVESGDVRLIDDADLRLQLIQALSQIDLYRGWMDDLATDGRAAFVPMISSESTARSAGRPWPEAASRDPDVLMGLSLLRQHLQNIVQLSHRSRTIVTDIVSAVEAELGR